eukprot:COSAG02_NODE_39001_length_422_cov_0.801858_1_plen_111_part_10
MAAALALSYQRPGAQLNQSRLPAVCLSQLLDDGARTEVCMANDISGEIVSERHTFNTTDDHSMTTFQDEAVNRIAVAMLHRRPKAVGEPPLPLVRGSAHSNRHTHWVPWRN